MFGQGRYLRAPREDTSIGTTESHGYKSCRSRSAYLGPARCVYRVHKLRKQRLFGQGGRTQVEERSAQARGGGVRSFAIARMHSPLYNKALRHNTAAVVRTHRPGSARLCRQARIHPFPDVLDGLCWRLLDHIGHEGIQQPVHLMLLQEVESGRHIAQLLLIEGHHHIK